MIEDVRAGINPAPTDSFVGEGFIPSLSKIAAWGNPSNGGFFA
jgi:hypothetical protein